MFSRLGKFKRVIVTGPQRSGTTICSKMIAHDSGLSHIDETAIRVDDLQMLRLLMRFGTGFVIQCPALARHVHEFRGNPDNCIVWMLRPAKDIVASQQRINWDHVGDEWARYGVDRNDFPGMPVCEFKLKWWRENQFPLFNKSPATAMEIEYGSLRTHPLWKWKSERRDFGPKQTA